MTVVMESKIEPIDLTSVSLVKSFAIPEILVKFSILRLNKKLAK
jgi:hypothetical protein